MNDYVFSVPIMGYQNYYEKPCDKRKKIYIRLNEIGEVENVQDSI